jgi:uncharacterized protein (TIGR02246 family)
MRTTLCAVAVAVLVHAASAGADPLRDAMEKDNAAWLAAFNNGNAQAFLSMYAKDALLLPPGTQPVTGGPEAIKQFWESRIKAGVREHTFEIVSVHEDGKYAYQVARWTAALVKDSGERTVYSGNTVRVFERQGDGRWLTKVHIYNRHQ